MSTPAPVIGHIVQDDGAVSWRIVQGERELATSRERFPTVADARHDMIAAWLTHKIATHEPAA